MRGVKAPSERGTIGAWAYEARAEADLSVEEVVERLARSGNGVSAATIRGVEGGSKKPSRKLLRAMADVYGRPIPGDPAPVEVADGAYLARIDALVEQLTEDRAVIRSLIALLRGTPQGPGPEPLIELATREVEAVDEAAGKPRPQTTSRPRRSARGRPSAERRRESREGETA